MSPRGESSIAGRIQIGVGTRSTASEMISRRVVVLRSCPSVVKYRAHRKSV